MDGLLCLVFGVVLCVCLCHWGLGDGGPWSCTGLLMPEIDGCRNGFFEMVRPAIRRQPLYHCHYLRLAHLQITNHLQLPSRQPLGSSAVWRSVTGPLFELDKVLKPGLEIQSQSQRRLRKGNLLKYLDCHCQAKCIRKTSGSAQNPGSKGFRRI